MRQTTIEPMSVEAYIQHELKSDNRHEYINGQLYEMPGEKDTNNEIAIDLVALLRGLLDYKVYTQAVKLGIPGGDKYYYPDVFATNEAVTAGNRYIKYAPALIIEVVSEGSHKHDYVDKYIDYTTIPSLQYYLIVEPEAVLVTVCEREGEDWVSHKYTSLEDTIQLPNLNIALPMVELYRSTKR